MFARRLLMCEGACEPPASRPAPSCCSPHSRTRQFLDGAPLSKRTRLHCGSGCPPAKRVGHRASTRARHGAARNAVGHGAIHRRLPPTRAARALWRRRRGKNLPQLERAQQRRDLRRPGRSLFLRSTNPECVCQGSGKSHTVSCILENALLQDERIGNLPQPLAALVYARLRPASHVLTAADFTMMNRTEIAHAKRRSCPRRRSISRAERTYHE